MSDLENAIDNRMAQYRPTLTPPLSNLRRRHVARLRMRAAAGAALGLFVIGVATTFPYGSEAPRDSVVAADPPAPTAAMPTMEASQRPALAGDSQAAVAYLAKMRDTLLARQSVETGAGDPRVTDFDASQGGVWSLVKIVADLENSGNSSLTVTGIGNDFRIGLVDAGSPVPLDPSVVNGPVILVEVLLDEGAGCWELPSKPAQPGKIVPGYCD